MVDYLNFANMYNNSNAIGTNSTGYGANLSFNANPVTPTADFMSTGSTLNTVTPTTVDAVGNSFMDTSTGTDMSWGETLGFTNPNGSMNWSNIGNMANVGMGMGQAYLGFQQLDLAQEQFDFQKNSWQEQFDIQKEEYDRQVSERNARVAANQSSAQTISAGG